MKIDPSDFRVTGDEKVDLKKWPTDVDHYYASDSEYERILAKHVAELSELQRVLYASNSYSVLLIFQAMDTAGKDGAISHVLTGVNPQGCEVTSFKHPSEEELDHDFMWRTNRRLPTRGRIGVFNRSYYEEVLVVRVHPEILAAERIPDGVAKKKSVWKHRYRSIVEHERHLHINGTLILKFFLHISKDEQRRRLIDRIDDPSKTWKFSPGDVVERGSWKEYMKAYEACFNETSAPEAPWHIIPADDKKNARLIVSRTIINALKDLKLKYPEVSEARKAELEKIREQLMNE